jgi:hypothetical protein
MSDGLLFNWGGRGLEWDAIQRKLEQDAALHEQAMRIKFSQNAQTGGVGGGSKLRPVTPAEPAVSGPAVLLTYVDDQGYWRMVVINFEKGTLSDPIETGVPYLNGDSYIAARYDISHNEGFQIVFYNDDTGLSHCFFVTAGGVVAGSVISGNYKDGNLDGVGTYLISFEEEGTAVFTAFDGVSVTSHALGSVVEIEIGSYLGRLVGELGPLVTIEKTRGEYETWLLRWDGTKSLVFTHEEGVSYVIVCDYSADFIVAFDYVAGAFTRARKWTGSGLVLEETSFDEFEGQLNAIVDTTFYGTSKYVMVFYNDSSSNVPYVVFWADSESSSLSSHPRGKDYPVVSIYATPKRLSYPANLINEKAVVVFRNSGTPSLTPGFDDFVNYTARYFGTDGETYDYVFVLNSLKSIAVFDNDAARGAVYAKDPVIGTIDEGGNLVLNLFTDSGRLEIVTDIDTSDLGDLEAYAVSPGSVLLRYSLSSARNDRYWRVYDATGLVEEFVTSEILTYDDPPVNREGIVVIDEDDVSNSFAWSESRGAVVKTGLTQGSTYTIMGFPNVRNDFGTLTALAPGYQVVWETADGDSIPTRFFIFSGAEGWKGPFTTGLTGTEEDFSVQLGETVFYQLWKNGDGIITADVYSLSTGQRLVRLFSGYTEDDLINYSEYGDRLVLGFVDNAAVRFFFPTKTGRTLEITIPDVDFELSYNDVYWSFD